MKYKDILIRLRKITRYINLESKKIEKEFGISIPQLLIIQFLAEHEDFKASSKVIKEYLNLNASTVSGIISRLESKDLIARLPRLDDRRASFIVLTATGFQLLEKSPITLEEKLSNRIDKLSEDEISNLKKSIDILTDLLSPEDSDTSSNASSSEMNE